MSEGLKVLTFYLIPLSIVFVLLSAPTWWGFWRADRRASRAFARQRRERIAALIRAGIPPQDAERAVDARIATDAQETLQLVREVA